MLVEFEIGWGMKGIVEVRKGGSFIDRWVSLCRWTKL